MVIVVFQGNGTTAKGLLRGYATAAGPCPWREAPGVAPGAVLARCVSGASTEYTPALPDRRLPGGLWSLVVNVKDRAAVPAAQVLPVLVKGAVAAYG